jgi:putative peptide zinc metalloprotease protein
VRPRRPSSAAQFSDLRRRARGTPAKSPEIPSPNHFSFTHQEIEMNAVASIDEAQPSAVNHPRTRQSLQFTAPAEDGGRFVIHNPDGGSFFRLGADAVRVLRALDGHRSLEGVADVLGGEIAVEDLSALIDSFAAHGLVEVGTTAPSSGFDNRLDRSQARVRRTGLLSVQIELLDPSRVLDRAGPRLRWLTGPLFWSAAAAALVLGGIAAVAHHRQLGRMLTSPLPATPAVIAGLALVLSVVGHEFAHAAIAWRHGARARRMGVMLFYLAPSMFCDVSDCWRLPRRRDRVKVAGAGLAFQIIVGGVALGATLLPGLPRSVSAGLAIYGLGTGLLCAVNLLPFVRLDGYLMLMSALDVSNLRSKAIGDVRDAGARLFGVTGRARRLPHPALVLPYGLACALTPFILSAFALSRLHTLIEPLGPVGAVAWLAIVMLIAVALLRRILRALHARRGRTAADQPQLWRIALAAGLTLAILIGVGGSLTHSDTTVGAFMVRDGKLTLFVDTEVAGRIAAGERVALREPGMLGSESVGSATVAGGSAERVLAPGDPTAVRGVATGEYRRAAFLLRAPSGRFGESGQAVVTGGRESLVGWVTNTYLANDWRLLFG